MGAHDLTTEELARQTAFLRRLVLALVGDASRAEDIVQDTWVAAMERPPRHGGNLRGWLAKVARRLALRNLRGEVRRKRREGIVARPGSVTSSTQIVESLEWHQRVARAVLDLAEPYRSAVVLRFYEDRTLREVATRQGVSVSTASTRVREAIRQLRSRLDDEAGGSRLHWRTALIPLLGLPPGRIAGGAALATRAAITGGIIMSTKVTTLATFVLVAAVFFVVGWHVRPIASPPDQARRAVPRERGVLGGAPPRTEVPPIPGQPSGAIDAPDGQPAGAPPPGYLERLQQAKWPEGSGAVAAEIAGLPPEEGWAIVQRIFRHVEDEQKRKQLVTAFRGPPPHLHFLDVAHLGVKDVSPRVTGFCLGLVERLGMTRFADDISAYEAWRAKHAGAPIETIIRDGAVEFADRLRDLHPNELVQALGGTHPNLLLKAQEGDAVDRAAILREAGVLDILERVVADPDASNRLRTMAQWWVDAIGPEHGYLGRHYREIAASPGAYPADLAIRAYGLIGAQAGADAIPLLVGAFERTPRKSDWMSIAMALAKTEDPRVIPHLIGMIEADGTYASIYGVGWLGLGKLTGVSWDKAHDGAWWRAWWEKNKSRFPAEARTVAIPVLSPVAK